MHDRQVALWGREFKLIISYDHYDDGVIPNDMAYARDKLFESWDEVENALPELKWYCLSCNAEDVEQLYGSKDIDNIFRIVIPDYLFVQESSQVRTVALMLDYRFDPEEGLALLFKDEKLAAICPQSEVF